MMTFQSNASLPKYFLAGMLTFLSLPTLADTFPLPPPGTDVVGDLRVVMARQEDTLLDIARRYNLGYNEITDANPTVDPWLPGAGTPVLLPTQFILPNVPRQGIVLNIATMRMFYYPAPKPGESPVVITHPIGIGKEGWSTPVGVTKVVSKQKDPTWNVPVSIQEEHAKKGEPLPSVVPPGPDNPLGQFAFRLGLPGYLIHGTNKPSGIGMRVSHGCIHLYPEDIARLFNQIPVGAPVQISNQPYLAGWRDGTLYLETHKPLEEDAKALDGNLTPVVNVIIGASGEKRRDINWRNVIRITRRGGGYPLPISANSPALEDIITDLPLVNEPQETPAPAAVAPARSANAENNDADAPSPPSEQAAYDTKRWYVQAGNFKNIDKAHRLSAMLRHLGPPIPALQVAAPGGHRVLAGPFANKTEAQSHQKLIQTRLGIETFIKPPEMKRQIN